MKGGILRIGISVVIALLIIGGGFFLWQNYQFPVYRDYSHGVTTRYPRGWTIKEGERGTVAIFVSPKEAEYDLFQDNISVVVQDFAGKDIDLRKYTKLAIQDLQALFSNVNVVESEAYLLGGQPAHRFSYEVRAELDLRLTHVWMIKGEQAFQVSLTCEQDQYPGYAPIFNTVLKSFKVQ